MTELLYTSNTFANFNHPIKDADVVFLGIPFASTGSSKQATYGPVVVREMLKVMSGLHKGFDIFEQLNFADVGDVNISWGSYDITANRIKETIDEFLTINENAFPVFIGGEHLISLPIVEALEPRTIVHFDAHGDISETTEEVEFTHATWAYHASKKSKVIQIGVTNYTDEELDNIKKHGVTIFDMNDDIADLKMKGPVHISIDVDVLSPEYVVTGHPEGTMKPQELYSMLEKIKATSLDITEIAEDKLHSNTGIVAGEMMKRVLYSKFAE